MGAMRAFRRPQSSIKPRLTQGGELKINVPHRI
jgi:hypothetical protein